MRLILYLAITCILVDPIISRIFREHPDENTPADKCRPRRYDIGDMSIGEDKYVPGECFKASCLEDRSIRYKGCSFPTRLPPDRNCSIVEGDKSKLFPLCCTKTVCYD